MTKDIQIMADTILFWEAACTWHARIANLSLAAAPAVNRQELSSRIVVYVDENSAHLKSILQELCEQRSARSRVFDRSQHKVLAFATNIGAG